MRALWLAFALLLACVAQPGYAAHRGNSTPVSSTCPYGIDNGCSGANQSASIIFPNFFTTVRQSGQGQYKTAGGTGSDHPPPFNVSGVDFPVGAEPDNTLKDITTNLPAGCNLVPASHWIRGTGCQGAVLDGYRFNGYGIYQDSTNLDLVINNSHFTVTADNCRNYGGTGMISTHGGTGGITVTNSTFDFDDGCKMNADLYKTANDPGFVDQSSGTASFSGTTLTFSAINSGTVRIGQYIDCVGCTHPTQITGGSGLSWTVSPSQGTLGPVTVTTGPVQTTENGPIAFGSSGKVTLLYNANIDSGQFASASTDVDARYNFEKIISANGQHVNFIFNAAPGTPTTADFTLSGNTIYWDKYAHDSGTGTLDLFTSSASASDSGPVVYDHFNVEKNVVIANPSAPNASTNTNALVRYLGQKGSGPDILYAMSGGVISVTYINGGTNPTQINVGSVVQCTGTITCSLPVQFGTQISGTTGGVGTYNTSNTVDTVTQRTGGVASYTVTNGGSGYATAPAVTISGGGGSGAVATANISGGAVTSISVNNQGSGYSSRPTVSFGGPGTGATADANISTTSTFRVSNYNGTINNQAINDNYFDATGAAGVYNFDVGDTWVTNPPVSSGNVNMLTGASCNVGGSC